MEAGRDERYRELFDHGHDGVFLLDVTPAGRFLITAFNPAEERLVGVSNAQATGHYVDELFPSDVAAPLVANYRRCVAAGAPITYEETLDLPAGRRACVTTLIPIFDDGNRVHRIIGVARDVSVQKDALLALRASEERFRQLAETIHEVFWMIDVSTSELLYVSPSYEAMWGRTCESLRTSPRSWRDSVHPDDRVRVEALAPRYGEEPTDATYRIVRPDGSQSWIRDRSFPVRNDDGAVYRVVGIAEDVSDLMRAEEQLRQAQKLEAVGQLAGGVAHDFNNLLSVILSYSDFLLESLGANDPRHADVAEIKRAGQRAADLTRQLLAFSRKQIVQPRLIDFAHTVLAMQKMLRRLIAEDVELVVSTASSTGSIYADPGQIEQVLVNLAVNARDAMPNGGKLVIETSRTTVAADGSNDVSPGDYVALTVKDTGVGMDAATRARIFEPFFTTKEKGKGTGLGLATVFGVAQQCGGTVRVESVPGHGATFTVLFPRANDSVPTHTPPPVALGAPPGTETILIAEDDEQVRTLARSILRRLGYVVLEAQNAGEALLVSEQHAGPIHLLLTDVVMPRMSGRKLAERVTAARPEMKVLYMSGYPDDSVMHHNVVDKGIALIEKPLTPDALGAKVREVIDG